MVFCGVQIFLKWRGRDETRKVLGSDQKNLVEGLVGCSVKCSRFPHCHWETRVGTSMEGTAPGDHTAVTWLRSYGEKWQDCNLNPGNLFQPARLTTLLLHSSPWHTLVAATGQGQEEGHCG